VELAVHDRLDADRELPRHILFQGSLEVEMSDWRNLIAIVVVIALLTTVATLAFSQHADEIRCFERKEG
jgi:hypothetical protein